MGSFSSLAFFLIFAAAATAVAAGSAASDEVCALEDVEVHAVFAVDASRSVIDRDFNIGMQFVSNFTKFMGNINSTHPPKLGIFQFAAKPEDMLDFGTPDDWEKTAFRLTWKSRTEDNGVTNTERALKHMMFIFNERSKQSAINASSHTVVRLGFVLTDGQATNKENLVAEIGKLRLLNVTMYGIGVGEACPDVPISGMDCMNVSEVELIAGSANRTFFAEDYSNLQNIQMELFQKICEDIRSNITILISIGVGVLAGIVIGCVLAVVAIYAIQDFIRKKVIIAQLAAGEAALKNQENPDSNPLYKNPVTTVTV